MLNTKEAFFDKLRLRNKQIEIQGPLKHNYQSSLERVYNEL